MKRVMYGAFLVLLLILTFIAGNLYHFRGTSKIADPERRVLYPVDPMNLTPTSDKPGISPGGMKKEPVSADETLTGKGPGKSPSSMPWGTVKISPEKQQTIGVKTVIVDKSSVKRAIRTVGRVAADETRTYRLIAAVEGWIRETYDDGSGSEVKKDQRLAAFYTPQFRIAQNAFFSALASFDRIPTERSTSPQDQLARINLQSYIDALEVLGVSQVQIKELAETRVLTDKIYIVAPATGFILSRNVSPSQRFDKGVEWYRLADLSKVWILADLFRNEAGYVKPGMIVRVTEPHQEKEFHARVAKVLTQFDPNSRTLKVRLELDNPGFILKPDAFVDVELPVTLPPALTVPADAVFDSGLKKTIFVDRGNGFFEPRQVQTGWRLGDRIEITKGLMEGERIVASGTFLIDSESRLELAAEGMTGTLAKDFVCGADVSINKAEKAGRRTIHSGITYYFSSDECKEKFDKNPGIYVKE